MGRFQGPIHKVWGPLSTSDQGLEASFCIIHWAGLAKVVPLVNKSIATLINTVDLFNGEHLTIHMQRHNDYFNNDPLFLNV